MPRHTRPRRESTDEGEQVQLFVSWPEQERYERLRPVVLLGQTSEERARAMGVAERTLDHKADRFAGAGLLRVVHAALISGNLP